MYVDLEPEGESSAQASLALHAIEEGRADDASVGDAMADYEMEPAAELGEAPLILDATQCLRAAMVSDTVPSAVDGVRIHGLEVTLHHVRHPHKRKRTIAPSTPDASRTGT